MSVRQGWWMSISLGLLFVGSNVLAEGHGHGLNRALSAAARGSGNSGLARATQSTARFGNGVSQDGARLGRSANGLNRASNGMSHSQALSAQTSNATRIRDHRLEQADHLREISARNGNTRLLDTADRMETSAQTNYDRGAGGIKAAGGQTPGTDDRAGGITARTSVAAPPAQPAQNPRTSWLPAWLRTSR